MSEADNATVAAVVPYRRNTATPTDELPLYPHILAAVIFIGIAFGLCYLRFDHSLDAATRSTIDEVLRYGGKFAVLGVLYLMRETRWVSSTGFRAMIVWQIALMLLRPLVDVALVESLSQDAKTLRETQMHTADGSLVGATNLLGIAALLFAFVGGLCLWRPARWAYVAAIGLFLLLNLFGSEISVEHGMGAILFQVNVGLAGILLLVQFCCPSVYKRAGA